jgi:rubrerythrin
MSLHNIAKGTPLEKISEMLAMGEAKGTMMYYALARLAKEQGLDDVAEEFIEAANQEAVHAGFYATTVGMYPKDFWNIVRGTMAAEYGGEKTIKGFADKFRAAGFAEAADEMEIFAKQEGHHGEKLKKILEKYRPELLDTAGKKIYVCGVCGFEYIGNLDSESEEYICPVCGQPKKVFRLKA